jgi:NAD(P)-dependent dehydrogenase (short-subunit alcohol dehydrogenase family)
MRLEGKVGIVTAAASGMGRAGARRFAREGAAVGVVDIDQAGVDAVVGEITGAGGRALGLVGDLRQDDFARSVVRRTANTFGGLDFVWNHVGHPGPASIEGIDMADFEIAMDLNLRTVLVTTEAAIPEIRARGGGSLLYTASTSGIQGSAFSPVYSMAKFGVVGFVRSLAKPVGPRENSGQCDLPRPDRHADATGLCRAARPTTHRRSRQGSARCSARSPEPYGPHRKTRGNRQRCLVPDLRRSLLRVRRRVAGRRRRYCVIG